HPELLRRGLRLGSVGLPELVVSLLSISNILESLLEDRVLLATSECKIDGTVGILALRIFSGQLDELGVQGFLQESDNSSNSGVFMRVALLFRLLVELTVHLLVL